MSIKSKEKHLKSMKSRQFQVFLLFLIMSFFLLIVTKLSKDYIHVAKVGVIFKNVPLDLVIPPSTNFNLTVTTKGSGFEILYNTLSKKYIQIDFRKDIESIENEFIWYYLSNQLKLKAVFKSQIEVIDVFPKKISIAYDKEFSKKVPVKLNSVITFSPGYDLEKPQKTIPDSVLVVGSQIDLNTINYIDSEVIKLNKLQNDFEGVAKLIPPISETQVKLSHSEVITKIEVDKFTEGTVEVPVLIKNIPKDVSINYFPKHISVTYYLPLSDYGKFQASDFKIECDFKNTLNSDFTFMIAELVKIPKSVKKARLSSDKVEFIFLK